MNRLFQNLMLGSSAAALMVAGPIQNAFAQGDNNNIEQVVVSASRVTIAGYTQPTPVTVVGVAQLEKNGYANIQDAVRELPQVTSPPSTFSANSGAAINATQGLNLLDLRTLGITRTLVLFDGQRVVQSAASGGVDISTIPSGVVSRIDVVTGGASAAWGSDAVSGVVNFVLNKNFEGLKGTLQLGSTKNANYRSARASAAWGGDILEGRGHLVLAMDYDLRPDVVMQGNQDWYKATYLVSNPAYVAGNGQPQMILANNVGHAHGTPGGLIVSSPAVTAANSPTGVAVAANALRGIEFVGNGIPQLVNFGNITAGVLSNGGSLTRDDTEQNLSVVGLPQARYTAFVFGRYKLTDTIQASLQLNYGYSATKDFTQPGFQTGVSIKSDNAYIPASVRATMASTGITSFTMGIIQINNLPINVSNQNYYQTAEGALGPPIMTNQHQLMRGVFTLDGTIGDNWSWNAYYQHSTVRYWTHAWGDDLNANLVLAEDAVTVTSANRGTSGLPLGGIACRSTLTAPTNGCIPLNVFGNGVASPAAIKYITGNNANFLNEQMNQDEASASMQGTLPWELPAGKVAVVFGAGYRKEAITASADPRGISAAWSTGNWSMFPPSHYYVYEGFGEVDAPLLKNDIVNSLDFSAAGRITDYSTSGMVETWKLGLTSQVNDDIKLRTTWSVDIRAPQLNDLFALASQSNSQLPDPKTQISVNAFTNTIGNPNLGPEVARTISGGVVLTPHWVDGLQLSVDYYSINLTDAIGTISTNTILQTCTLNINDPLCSRLIFAGPVGAKGPALSTVTQFNVNVAAVSTSGFDTQLNYVTDFSSGTMSIQSVASYMDQITQSQPGTITNDYAGVISNVGGALNSSGTPKWKGVVGVTYDTGPLSFTTQVRWYGTAILNNQWNTGNLTTAATADMVSEKDFHIPMNAYIDLRGSYKWNDNLNFFGAIDNVQNIPPQLVPMTSRNIVHAVNSQPGTYDLLGRQYRIGVRFNY